MENVQPCSTSNCSQNLNIDSTKQNNQILMINCSEQYIPLSNRLYVYLSIHFQFSKTVIYKLNKMQLQTKFSLQTLPDSKIRVRT